METKRIAVKKTQPTTHVKEPVATAAKSGDFLGEIKGEFKKITWTTPEELRTYTKVVVGATFAFGLGIYAIDLVLQTGLKTIEFLMKVITG